MEKAVARTMKHKVLRKKPRQHKLVNELKGAKTDFAIKKYFYRHVANLPFKLYSVILDKAHSANDLLLDQQRTYNFIARLVLKEIPLEHANTQVILTLDRSMSSFAIQQFNASLRAQLESRIPLNVPLDINHYTSHENKLLQAVDLFSWGIYRKYEAGDTEWYDAFREKVAFEQVHPENKKENGP